MVKPTLQAAAFGKDFHWGVAISAAQNEGAVSEGGRSASIWDVYSRRKGVIKKAAKPMPACDFYHRYRDDLLLVKALGFTAFRFSISWSRILPDGSGKANPAGIVFYQQLIEECHALGLTPFVTLYHWDLPQVLQAEGGWESPLINRWFRHFAKVCAKNFGTVKHWIVLNEPAGFTTLGHLLGIHAPGRRSMDGFLKAVHHAAIAQADGARVLRQYIPDAKIGTSFSCSEIIPYSDAPLDIAAARRIDLFVNRLFVEPLLGKGFPEDDKGIVQKMNRLNKSWKYASQMQFDMDFIGLQNYFPLVVKHASLIPVIQAAEVKPAQRKVPVTAMGWEINADSFQHIIRRFWKYGAIKEIMITENGAAFKDSLQQGRVNDQDRINYYHQYLDALFSAKREGVKLGGYFAWTLMDNFEWAEGYEARFGLVHVDLKTQLRTVKESGFWWRDFLKT
ncbi:GH1 family beta-glucosidase [Flavihumibacter sp. CACIAM 22H1]|uniref:GH1 family beta-glucosidase n=1 Tax=Flavihumibacter sp. CACIAM 22H1 TaxID=1812911 RepID=UPI0007A7F30D|nr:GH1 family beta-glucosidase [Flavihumibacter sp. CACIAM 22H1]KYP15034.1 MAG: beta-galactosidase [Flavihumibacter sp. CACIAM 22H1]